MTACARHTINRTDHTTGDSLTEGAPEGLVIAVPSEAYGTYLTDYFWARYARVLARMEGE